MIYYFKHEMNKLILQVWKIFKSTKNPAAENKGALALEYIVVSSFAEFLDKLYFDFFWDKLSQNLR
jgi:hypothetical protein